MLSYRHAFHAGNFADVLKHLVLIRTIRYLQQKPKPFLCIDTHAGAGIYALNSPEAGRNREFDSGIGKLLAADVISMPLSGDAPPPVADYLQAVKAANIGGKLERYPGSPWLLQHLLRAKDRLVLCELHSTDFRELQKNMPSRRNIKIYNTNGLTECIAHLPPLERRGVMIIDPSYETPSERGDVIDALANAYQRFATGTLIIWFPMINRHDVNKFEEDIAATGISNIQEFELCIRPDSEPGMSGSVMIVVNPPWPLMDEMKVSLPWLSDRLGIGRHGSWRARQLVNE
jgi:23S rRNA (adenine2030-N6)-methyltransferase